VHRKYIQQGATLHSLFISWNCSTRFGWYIHPSSGAHTTVSTASGICHTFSAICRYRGRVGTGLSVLWVANATNSTLKRACTKSFIKNQPNCFSWIHHEQLLIGLWSRKWWSTVRFEIVALSNQYKAILHIRVSVTTQPGHRALQYVLV
jgi:hypothetical protein